MFREFSKIMTVLLAVILISGCGVSVRTYTKDVKRVDQEMNGNAGFLKGTPQQPDRSNIRSTRRTYVVEFEKSQPWDNEDVSEATSGDEQTKEEIRQEMKMRGSDYPPAVVSSPKDISPKQTTYVQYTIEKNDTLQKISKKFYDTYRKWQKIYDANKEVIKNPNHIKPGVIIRIPQE